MYCSGHWAAAVCALPQREVQNATLMASQSVDPRVALSGAPRGALREAPRGVLSGAPKGGLSEALTGGRNADPKAGPGCIRSCFNGVSFVCEVEVQCRA